MKYHSPRMGQVLRHPWAFTAQVVKGFMANQGFLLSGAVAYFTLLSVVPIFILLLVGLSQVVDSEQLLATLQNYLQLVVPGQADFLFEEVQVFVTHRGVAGLVGLAMLLMFSAMAFTALENAMSMIFHHRPARRRHFLISVLIPYGYILVIGLGLLLVTFVSGALQGLGDRTVTLGGAQWALEGLTRTVIYLIGVVGEILLLTSLYIVMPVGRIVWRHALIGGAAAGILWEISRHVLVWYFSSLSLVSLIYGSLATTVVVLITFEVAAVIVLLGAQFIAEYERGLDKGGGQNG